MSNPATRARPMARLLDRMFVRGTVEEIEDLTPRLRRIRITGDAVGALEWTPGQHVRVRVGPGLRDMLRTYSVWAFGSGGLDLCVFEHGEDGPGSRWAREVRQGQRVSFTKPEGRFVPRPDAPYHVFAGDETASVAFGAILRALPAGAPVYGVVELGSPEDALPLRDLGTTERGSLVAAVRALELPSEPGVAYLAGETRTCQAVRSHLVRERGWPRRSVLIKPFWMPGKRGMD
ncbi:siderophore-interacting protein [Amycolatopsis acidicola]|uniref:Siderophore-interacting protein n=1 Tax=Amycolatopsis acidicola TaxID=2596893 RepID=A0A5N0UMG9_9PSEU|nr:siderophore-interacting protein [Amycolatopsis acidicola]KAA9150719.1 siderophore-interacting protein [Amycolatopsis acidicola]